MVYFVSSSYYDDCNESKMLAFNVLANDITEALKVAKQEIGLFGIINYIEVFDNRRHLIAREKI